MIEETQKLLHSRKSVRAYRTDKIEKKLIESILIAARCAPSGANLQPGRFHVLAGEPLKLLTEKLLLAATSGRPVVKEYSYFPEPMSKELKAKQRAAGFALYNALGIEKRETKRRREQFNQNYVFFNAPVGIIVTIDRNMGKGCFMDLGMVLMSLFISAESHGLGTSGIGALANHGDLIHKHLDLAENELVVCGIALGFPEHNSPVNKVQTGRDSVESYTSFHGF